MSFRWFAVSLSAGSPVTLNPPSTQNFNGGRPPQPFGMDLQPGALD